MKVEVSQESPKNRKTNRGTSAYEFPRRSTGAPQLQRSWPRGVELFSCVWAKNCPPPTKKSVWARIQPKSIAVLGDLLRKLRAAIEQRTGAREAYPVVIINWVQYLGPPVPFSFPDSRDLLEVSARLVNVRVNKTVERGTGSTADGCSRIRQWREAMLADKTVGRGTV